MCVRRALCVLERIDVSAMREMGSEMRTGRVERTGDELCTPCRTSSIVLLDEKGPVHACRISSCTYACWYAPHHTAVPDISFLIHP